MLSKERIKELGAFIKWDAVFRAAGLKPSTMRSAKRLRDPRPEEVKAIVRALGKKGVYLSDVQPSLFNEEDGVKKP